MSTINDTNINSNDDIIVEDAKETELSSLKEETRQVNRSSNSNEKKEYTEEELTKMINSYDPPAIKDWPKIPYKTIFITFLLFFSSILFIYTGVKKYKENEKWTSWLSYTALGGLLSIPGFYYTFYIVCIVLKVKGYEYEDLPDLSDN